MLILLKIIFPTESFGTRGWYDEKPHSNSLIHLPLCKTTKKTAWQAAVLPAMMVRVAWRKERDGDPRHSKMYVSCLPCWISLIELGQIGTFINCDINHYLELADAVAPG